MKIKIAIADDHPLVINGLHHILDGLSDMQITGSYYNGTELLAGIAQQLPDILLLDIQMPGQTGDELAPIIAAQYPTVKMLALTNQDDIYYINTMFNRGVLGYVLKTTSEDILLDAIHTLHRGGEYLDPALKEKVIQQTEQAERIKNTTPILSHREKEVLVHIAADLTSQEIADIMFISKRTIDNHRQSLLLKLAAKNTASLVKKAIQLGLIQ